jgi:peptide/nickel transport system permease protein
VSRLSYLVRRLALSIVVVIGVVTVAFVVARALPGDPVRMLLGPQARAADVARARAIYALDEPIWRQYTRFWARLVHPADDGDHGSCAAIARGAFHVDLGFSYRYRKPVVELVAQKAPISARLAVAALLVQALIGLSVGLAAGRSRGTLWDQLAIGTTVVATSAPIFGLGMALQYLLAHRLGFLPFDGYGETDTERLVSMILPALTLGLYGAALYARLVRDETARALSSDYVKAARARGVGEARVMVVHALRNAVVPIATLMVLELGALIGGAIVTEKLFRWPGMGSMVVDAMVHRDGPVILGTVLFGAAVIVIASLIVDLLTVIADPRLRG